MELLVILALTNNMLLTLFEKWKFIEKYETYRPAKFPNWCELCFLGWLSIIEYIYLNILETLSFYIAFSVFAHSLACWFISLIVRKGYLILKQIHENNNY